ncbi:MAG: radical SAM protein [Geobacter sp.]|nr:MAG: radical SAM protein [Geobacter sp.]
MRFLENIGMMITYQCQVACPHCIVEAGPDRSEKMDSAEAKDWLRQAAAYNSGKIKGVSLTGGEPFYDVESFKNIMEFGNSAGLFMTAVTNAHWATSLQDAIEVLRSVPSLKMLGISTDVYHQQFINFERVAHAIRAAEILHIPIQISVCTDSKMDPGYQDIIRKLQQIAHKDTIDTVITYSVGRAASMLQPEHLRVLEPPVSACTASGSPIIFPDGRVIACIGPLINLAFDHHLVLGNLRDASLDDILNRAQLNPILHTIRIWGPHRLLQLLERKAGTVLLNQFLENNVCDICHRIFANQKIQHLIESLAVDREFIQMIAYARAFYLKENEMLELLSAGRAD